MKKKNLFITVEGIDGSGKTTFAGKLGNLLEEQDIKVLLTKEPGGSGLGKQLRSMLNDYDQTMQPKSEFLLFAADRAEHIETVVKPALKNNLTVISDRGADSSLAYQGFGKNVCQEKIELINNWAMDGCRPDIVFYLKLDIQTALGRIKKRNESITSFERKDKSFWINVLNGFETIFKNRDHVITLDGTKTPEQLAQDALSFLSDYL